eukprot:TRINITY_DN25152_c0_g1_i2.p1 TRINITY_DN25152_c0_g1~~TRINITY_DN25152_c0_g1_i2.p1  ORF type:complete len:571 (+),score=87.36 TRINITY_DN25152_c0_g1_i2:132-1715(+)
MLRSLVGSEMCIRDSATTTTIVGVTALKSLIPFTTTTSPTSDGGTATASSSSLSYIRVETPWMELEGRDFFTKNKSQQMNAMLLRHNHPNCGQNPRNIDPTVELYRAHEAQRSTKRSLLNFNDIVVGATTTHTDDGNPLIGEGEGEDVGFTSLFGMFLPTEQEDDAENNTIKIGNNSPENDEGEHQNNNSQSQLQPSKQKQQKHQHHSTAASRIGNGGGGNTRHLVEAVTGDKYFITGRSLGEGTYGCVVLALHETGGLVAMKQIPIGSLEGGVEPLIAEMALLQALNYPCIASYVTCAVSSRNDTFYIMTEYLPAGSLSDLINTISTSSPPNKNDNTTTSPQKTKRKNVGFTLETTCRYAHDIADGLHYLHSRQPPVLHLDIKPDNVLMTGGGSSGGSSCKLIDFGTSKFFVEAESSTTVRGTPRYMAPEAAMGEVSPASDVYSVGITILHMLLGHSPWSHILGDDNAFIMRLMRGSSEMVLQMPAVGECDPEMISLIEACTAKNPQHRPSAKEVRNRLAHLLVIK